MGAASIIAITTDVHIPEAPAIRRPDPARRQAAVVAIIARVIRIAETQADAEPDTRTKATEAEAAMETAAVEAVESATTKAAAARTRRCGSRDERKADDRSG